MVRKIKKTKKANRENKANKAAKPKTVDEKTLTKSVDEALKCETAEELIALIQRELGHGQYIYRGVPEKYEWKGRTDISSSIFIKYRGQKDNPSKLFDGDIRPVDIERDIALRAKRHFHDSATNREILTNIRHFGGLTTLIDFSHDLMVALFFACQNKLDESGQPDESCQLIAYNLHGEIKYSKHSYFSETPDKKDTFPPPVGQMFSETPDKKDTLPKDIEFVEPAITTPASSARVIAQKSIFVHAPDGFIPPETCTIFSIPSNLKAKVLAHLKRFHHIDQKTIYNDMHGFIDLENRFATAREHALAGNTLFERGEHEDAKIEFTKAINQDPDFAEAYYNRGITNMELEEFDNAIKDFTDAIRLRPDYAESYYLRGGANVKLEQFGDAIKDFTSAIQLKPDDAYAYASRGGSRMCLGQFNDAIKDFTESIRLKPDFVEAYYHRAEANIKLEKFKEAVDDSTVAINLKPDFFGAYCSRGGARIKLGKFKEAIKDFTEAIRLKPDYAPAYMARAVAWDNLDNNKNAQEDFDKAKELGYEIPNNEIVLQKTPPPNPQKDPALK